ncbi:unnamed protein product [Auanema sp. JU1783]|nr:unnamed protein product [Auanema sp. JU1783]
MGVWRLYNSRKRADGEIDNFLWKVQNLRRVNAGEPKLQRGLGKLKAKLAWLYPPFHEKLNESKLYHRIFKEKTQENCVARLVRDIVIFEIFGVLVYSILCLKYVKDPALAGTLVSIPVHIVLSLMFVFPSIMYYFMLSTHRMFSSKLRTLFLVVILSISFDGPAMNALNNVHKMAEGVGCIQEDVMGSVHAVDENIVKHGQMAVQIVQKLIHDVSEPLNYFRNLLHRLDRGVNRVIQMIQNSWKHLSEVTNECKKAMRGPYITCLNTFRKAYLTCTSNEANLGTHVCDKIKEASKMCDAGKTAGGSVCNFPEKIQGGITEGVIPFYKAFWKKVFWVIKKAHYFHIKAFKYLDGKRRNITTEIKNLQTLGLQISSKRGSEKSSFSQMKENLKRTLSSIIETYRASISLLASVVHYSFLPIALFWPYFSTALFIYKYNYREDYKNFYITKEFQAIDLDCILKGTSKVLPLTSKEQETFLPRTAWRMTETERGDLKVSIALTMLAMSTPIIFMVLDQSIYWILIGVFNVFGHTKIETPPHYEIKVSGEGYTAKLLNSLLETFSPITSAIKDRDQRWRACFDEPTPPDYFAYLLMLGLFLICLMLCRTKVWLSRQSLAMADYFYPHRVRPRALFLYNKILSERKSLMTLLISRQKAIFADEQQKGREQLIRQSVQSKGLAKVICTRCRKTDMSLADQANTRLCVECGSFYCIHCFSLTLECKACLKNMQIIDGIELYYEDRSDDEGDIPSHDDDSEKKHDSSRE